MRTDLVVNSAGLFLLGLAGREALA